MFQDFRLIDEMNVYDNVAFAMHAVEAPGRLIKKRVPQVLQEVGLSDKRTSFPNQLSGGEKQRVAIARAIVNNPQILLADEPTGNLDPRNALEIMTLINNIHSRGTTVLVVTHNRELVNQFHKRVIMMHHGVIARDVEEGGYIEA